MQRLLRSWQSYEGCRLTGHSEVDGLRADTPQTVGGFAAVRPRRVSRQHLEVETPVGQDVLEHRDGDGSVVSVPQHLRRGKPSRGAVEQERACLRSDLIGPRRRRDLRGSPQRWRRKSNWPQKPHALYSKKLMCNKWLNVPKHKLSSPS